MELNKLELDVAREVVNIGLSRAADSFSSILKCRALFLDQQISFRSIIDADHVLQKDDGKLCVLITDIMGQMEGSCYLLFTEAEANALKKACLPPSMTDPDQVKMMGDAMMLEIDNMISAAVVTEFANVLELTIYGDVPQLNELDRDGTLEMIKNCSQGLEYFISFKARLETENNISIEPEFVWLLGDDFVNKIKGLAHQTNILDELKGMSK